MFAEWLYSKAMSPIATKLAGTLYDVLKDPAARKLEEWKVTLQFGFDNYVKKEIERYSHVKTILGVNIPQDIRNIYVNLYVHISQERHTYKVYTKTPAIQDDDVISESEKKKRIVITGTAGAGKSMLMKYLFLQTLSTCDNKLPIFIELRELNDDHKLSILDVVHRKIREHIIGFSLEQTKFALKGGIIILFLDGFDEIDFDRKREKAKEIVSLGNQYDKSIIYVSSRPDDVFRGWERFHVYTVMYLSLTQVKLLIDKIPYDKEIKQVFVRKLDGGLYKTHKEFLINPLLVIMMLITLEQFAEIPAKIHLFYEYAFEALFARHDSTKSGGFQRKRHVVLALDDYRRLFSYFCTITYLKELFQFNGSNILDFLQKSIVASQINVDKTSMLEDFTNCTCMISRDGLDFVFSHRSFQEYFVAYFVSRVKSEEMGQVVPKLIARGRSDSVLIMMAEMNREKFEETWALPKLREIWAAIQKISPDKQLIEYVHALSGLNDPLILDEAEGLGEEVVLAE